MFSLFPVPWVRTEQASEGIQAFRLSCQSRRQKRLLNGEKTWKVPPSGRQVPNLGPIFESVATTDVTDVIKKSFPFMDISNDGKQQIQSNIWKISQYPGQCFFIILPCGLFLQYERPAGVWFLQFKVLTVLKGSGCVCDLIPPPVDHCTCAEKHKYNQDYFRWMQGSKIEISCWISGCCDYGQPPTWKEECLEALTERE